MLNTKKNKEKWVDKVTENLKMRGGSNKTIHSYVSAINRFLNYYGDDVQINKLREEDIIIYLKEKFLSKNMCGSTYNVNVCAIRYFYSICFDIELNKRKLPTYKLVKKLPIIIGKDLFIEIFNSETNIKHKCWLILGYYCGLRVDEVARVKIEDLNIEEHKLKVLGKGNKERYTILPDVVIKCIEYYCNVKNITSGYLFKGCLDKEHMNNKTIINYFTDLKGKYNLDKNTSFHALRHSFATNFLRAFPNDLIALKDMLGHSHISSTMIYVHLAQDYNKFERDKDE